MSAAPDAPPSPLTPEEIEHFIEKGWVWVRQAFSKEAAQRAVAAVFEGGKVKRAYKRTADGPEQHAISGLPLDDCRAWEPNRVDIETDVQVRLAEFAPKLAGALAQLAGGHELRREFFGEHWILNLDYREMIGDRPAFNPEGLRWHIDTPTRETTLHERFDAFTLLVLWSDVERHGGGTYFSTQAFHRFVDRLIVDPTPLDTADKQWAVPFVRGCKDFDGQVGQAGDVLITHAFMLHARPFNHRPRVRILENPTVMSTRTMDYSPSNPSPAPVEEAVIRRIRRLPELPAHLAADAKDQARREAWSRLLIEQHPQFFFPGREYCESLELEPRRTVLGLADWLFRDWVRTHATEIEHTQVEPAPMVRGVVRAVRSLAVTQRSLRRLQIATSLHEGKNESASWFRMNLGVMNCEGVNYIAQQLLLALGFKAYIYEIRGEGGFSHTLVLAVREGRWVFVDGWSDASLFVIPGLNFDGKFEDFDWEPIPEISGPLEGVEDYDHWASRGYNFERNGLYEKRAFLEGCALEDAAFGITPAEIAANPGGRPARRTPLDLLPTVQELDERAASYRAPHPEQVPESWRDYLRLRNEFLASPDFDEVAAYEAFLAKHEVGGVTKALVDQLLRRARQARRGG